MLSGNGWDLDVVYLGHESHLFCISWFVFHELVCSIVYSSLIPSSSRQVNKISQQDCFEQWRFLLVVWGIPKSFTGMWNCWALLSIACSCCWVRERSGLSQSWLQSLYDFWLCPSYVCKHQSLSSTPPLSESFVLQTFLNHLYDLSLNQTYVLVLQPCFI